MMQRGTLNEQSLENNILANLDRKHEKGEIVSGVGNDYTDADGIVTADGFGGTPEIAWNKAMNNFLCSLERPLGARITLLLPTSVKASYIAACMQSFQGVAERERCRIVGGHTQVEESFQAPSFVVELFGRSERTEGFLRKTTSEAADIVMAGYAGMLGTNLLLEREKTLTQHFSGAFLQTAGFDAEQLSIASAVSIIDMQVKNDNAAIYKMHDISAGGVYGALWQLGKSLQTGLSADNRKIPVRQETIELCEYLEKNPYLIDGTGALLIACREGRALVTELIRAGIPAAVIGKTIPGKERTVVFGNDEHRTLAPVNGEDTGCC